jgi:predicted phage tail protein
LHLSTVIYQCRHHAARLHIRTESGDTVDWTDNTWIAGPAKICAQGESMASVNGKMVMGGYK